MNELYRRPPRSTEQVLHPEKWQRGAGKFHRSEKVDLQDLSQALLVGLFKRANGANPRVVDKAIEAAEFFLAEF